MRLSREYEVDRVVSKDETRPHLCNCFLDVEKQKLVACDGHAMAVVPIVGVGESPGEHPNDTTGLVSPASIRAARKLGSKHDPIALSANLKHTLTDGTTMPRPTGNGISFPPYEQVLPGYRKTDENMVTFAFNAELLVQLCKAIGADPKNVTVTIPNPGRDPAAKMFDSQLRHVAVLDPLVVEGKDGAVGVLMPCRT
jgi:hypothetical protein